MKIQDLITKKAFSRRPHAPVDSSSGSGKDSHPPKSILEDSSDRYVDISYFTTGRMFATFGASDLEAPKKYFSHSSLITVLEISNSNNLDKNWLEKTVDECKKDDVWTVSFLESLLITSTTPPTLSASLDDELIKRECNFAILKDEEKIQVRVPTRCSLHSFALHLICHS